MSELDALTAALRRTWNELPALVGDNWPAIGEILKRLIAEGEAGTAAEVVVTTRIKVTLARYPRAYARVNAALATPTTPPRDQPRTDRPADQKPTEPAPTPRYVNLAIVRHVDLTRVPPTQGLAAGGRYQLRVDIGARSVETIVEAASQPGFPAERLPPKDGHWLEVTVSSDRFDVPSAPTPLFLPRRGASWTCRCAPGSPHACLPDERDPYAFVDIGAPSEPGHERLRVALWYSNNVVQSLLVEVDVVASQGDPGRQHAHVDFTLTHNLTDLGALPARAVGVLVNDRHDGTHTLVLNGGEDSVISVHFGEGTLQSAMDEFRSALLEAHIDASGGGRRNRLGPSNEKSRDQLIDDLARLAPVGRHHWAALYPQAREQLSTFARARGQGMHVARVESSRFVFPWAGIYDLPLERARRGSYDVCPLVAEWDGHTPLYDGTPVRCPREAEHAPKNMLCPFGFWGFRLSIEQPPSTHGKSLPLRIMLPPVPAAALAQSLALDADMAREHLDAVDTSLRGFRVLRAASADEVCTALGEQELGLAYFYCHGQGTPEDAWIEVGRDDHIYPEDIITWADVDWLPRDRHWVTMRPLVVLNGCHTAMLTPNSPVNFVDDFSVVGAAGVIGTEITLSQRLAGEAMETLLDGLMTRRLSVGEALHRMRARLLAKGNLLGLAYTAYCSSELRFD